MMSLMESLLSEMNRVRELIKLYDEIPNGLGVLGSTSMKNSIANTEKSISNDNVIEMLRCYEELKTHQG